MATRAVESEESRGREQASLANGPASPVSMSPSRSMAARQVNDMKRDDWQPLSTPGPVDVSRSRSMRRELEQGSVSTESSAEERRGKDQVPSSTRPASPVVAPRSRSIAARAANGEESRGREQHSSPSIPAQEVNAMTRYDDQPLSTTGQVDMSRSRSMAARADHNERRGRQQAPSTSASPINMPRSRSISARAVNPEEPRGRREPALSANETDSSLVATPRSRSIAARAANARAADGEES
ncbi:hypothetical protein BC829DRAFT_381054, partial [Chytridium lagenaria]